MYLDFDMTTLPSTHGMRPAAFGVPPIETLEMLQRLEAEVAMSNLNEMRLIEQQHPDWFEMYASQRPSGERRGDASLADGCTATGCGEVPSRL